MKKRVIIIAVVCLILLSLAGYVHVSLRDFVERSNLKEIIEESVGLVLDANVNIGEINVGFTPSISFQQLRVADQDEGSNFYLMNIGKIDFDYSFLNLLRKKFFIPERVSLVSPDFRFRTFKFPLKFFREGVLKMLTEGGLTTKLVIDGGGVKYNIPGMKTKPSLEELRGVIYAEGKDVIKVDIAGKLKGPLTGAVGIKGEVKPITGEYSLLVTLKPSEEEGAYEGAFIERPSGAFEIKNSTLVIQQADFFVKNFPVSLSGKIESYDTSPVFDFTFEIGGDDLRSYFDLVGDMGESTVSGDISVLGINYGFEGDMLPMPDGGWMLKDVVVNESIKAGAELDFQDHRYKFHGERGRRRASGSLEVKEGYLELSFSMDHAKIAGFDVVTFARVKLKPEQAILGEANLFLDGEIVTDYLVFDYKPLRDFKGTFKLVDNRIQNIDCTWGKGFGLGGSIDLLKPFLVDLVVRIEDVSVSEITELGPYLLPVDIQGKLGGRIEFRGEAQNPAISGNISVRDGKFERLGFDGIFINFIGSRSFLKLKDSKIVRGKTSYAIKGTVDFSLNNVLQDVRVTSEDRLVVWKGSDLSAPKEQVRISVNRISAQRLDLTEHEKAALDAGGTQKKDESTNEKFV